MVPSRPPDASPARTRHEVTMRPSRAGFAALALAAAAGPAAAQTATLGVAVGGSTFSQSGFYPPDTQGAVGPNHFVEMVNGRFLVLNKAGGVVTSSSLNQF